MRKTLYLYLAKLFIMKKLLLLSIVMLGILTPTQAQQKPITESNYELPARFTPEKMRSMVFSTMVDPHFLKSDQRFWYMWETPSGKNWYIVDPVKATKNKLFDPTDMAAQLTEIVGDPYDALHLPISNIRFNEAENGFTFQVQSTVDMTPAELEQYKQQETVLEVAPDKKVDQKKKIHYFSYDIASGKVTELKDWQRPKGNPSWANLSPDGRIALFTRDYDIYWMTAEDMEKAKKNEKDSTIVEHKVTNDGEEFFAWGGRGYSVISDQIEKNKGTRKGVGAIWSPDSKNFAIIRTDMRKVGDLWVINNTAEPRPTLESYKYHMPGEANAPQQFLYIFDTTGFKSRLIDVSAFKDQTISVAYKPQPKKLRDDLIRPSWEWLGSADKFYLSRTSRDLKRIDVCVVDVASGNVKPIIEERMNVSMEARSPKLLDNKKEIVQWSERSGWANLYLYDTSGVMKNKIVSGDFHVEAILGVDEATRTLYFLANGVEKGKDPYYAHVYKVNLDGTGMKRLNDVEFEHMVSMNDENRYFIDNYSRVNTTPAAVLTDNNGKKIMDLETADLSLLFAAGYKFPEIFTFKAADGQTDMYGVMYKPFDFDSTRLYPIIEYVYPGPQTEANNSAFSARLDRTDRLAQFGFVVITLGNRGGDPRRSKRYHTYGYGNLRDYGLADKKTAIEQLANKYPWIDRTKVGIHGHSGGGFMSTAAMLVYPNFFKVAVSSAGNHQNNIYNRWWSEKHHGVLEKVSEKGDTTFIYNIAKNADVAGNLKGKLLLVTGDIDENVHPANTITVVKALIKNNKRFDMLVLPGQRHGFGDMTEYFFWRMGDYFSEHLIGDKETTPDIVQMSK